MCCWKYSSFNPSSPEGNRITNNQSLKNKIRESGLEVSDTVINNAFTSFIKNNLIYIIKKGVIFNIVLLCVYVPLSIAGVFTIFFWDAPTTNYSELKILLLNIITWIGLSIPLLSIASIFTSAITRKRGKSKFSFIIQFYYLDLMILIINL